MDIFFRVEFKKFLLLQYSGTYTPFYNNIFGHLVILSDFCENLICYSPHKLVFIIYFKLGNTYLILHHLEIKNL